MTIFQEVGHNPDRVTFRNTDSKREMVPNTKSRNTYSMPKNFLDANLHYSTMRVFNYNLSRAVSFLRYTTIMQQWQMASRRKHIS